MDTPDLASFRAPEPDYTGWKVVHLKGITNGLAVNWRGWHGQPRVEGYDPAEHKGIVFIGEGDDKTLVRANSAYTACHVGWGRVAFEDLTLESSIPGGTILWASGFGWDPVWLTLRGVNLLATGPVKWGLMTHNTDDHLENVDIWCAAAIEHASYAHGHAKKLSCWKSVRVHGAGAECDKRVARPEEKARWFPDMLVLREDCLYADWHQPHSQMGGGFVLQGAAAHFRLKGCIFRPSARQPSKSLMVDDSFKTWGDDKAYEGSRFFDQRSGKAVTPQNVAPEDCANGFGIVEDCAIEGIGGASVTPMVRVGPQVGGTTHKLARGFALSQSGVYGRDTKVELIGVENDLIAISGCNTPKVAQAMRALGFKAEVESAIAVRGQAWRQVSQGFVPR